MGHVIFSRTSISLGVPIVRSSPYTSHQKVRKVLRKTNDKSCPADVPDGWSSWSEWTSSCNSFWQRSRERQCRKDGCALPCKGERAEYQDCSFNKKYYNSTTVLDISVLAGPNNNQDTKGLGKIKNLFINPDLTNSVICQNKATKGSDYEGTTNTTRSGKTCQEWIATTPHFHNFTSLDKNYCRLYKFLYIFRCASISRFHPRR